MKILTIDIGTGTQDIFLYDSNLDIENGFKLIVPSPTMIISRQIKAATARGLAVLLTGSTMGGGPSNWAAEAHAKAGLPIYATPSAARSFKDDLSKVERMGIRIIPEDQTLSLPAPVRRLELKDFDYALIERTFSQFKVSLKDLAGICIGVFDHGLAPLGVSDRKFRFDYLDERIRTRNSLTSFAYTPDTIPASMTRMQAVARSTIGLSCPVLIMDTAAASVLGATLDPISAARQRKMIVNVGNFHTIAIRLGPQGIEGLFEHHTGEINRPQLEDYLRSLADGTLQNEKVYNENGHGALIYQPQPLELGHGEWDLVVTGPRRSLFSAASRSPSSLRPTFATPYGDMMLAGNFGLLSAATELLPAYLADSLQQKLSGQYLQAHAPWEFED